MVFVCYVEHANHLFVCHVFVCVQGNIHRTVRSLNAAEVSFKIIGINRYRFLLAECDVIIAEVINRDLRHLRSCHLFGSRLRQVDFDIVGRRHRACHHKEQQEQEDEVGHRTHSECGFYPVSSLESHNVIYDLVIYNLFIYAGSLRRSMNSSVRDSRRRTTRSIRETR